MWEPASWCRSFKFPTEQKGHVTCLQFTPDSKTLISGSFKEDIVVWDVNTRQMLIRPTPGHSNSIQGLAIAPDGKTFATCAWDESVILWDLEIKRTERMIWGECRQREKAIGAPTECSGC